MKKYSITLAVLLLCVQLFAQTAGMFYQAVLLEPGTGNNRDQMNYVPNTELIVKFTITGTKGLEYQEEHQLITDDFGVFSAVIGEGRITGNTPYHDRDVRYEDYTNSVYSSRNFIEIDWDGTLKTLKVEISKDRSLNNFQVLETRTLSYIPYSWHKNVTAFGNMDVDGTTNLQDSMTVSRKAPTNLSGNLAAENTIFNDEVKADNGAKFKGKSEFNVSESDYCLTVNSNTKAGIKIALNDVTSDNEFMNFEGKPRDEDLSGVVSHGNITGKEYKDAATDPEFIFQNVIYAQSLGVQIACISLAAVETPLSAFSLVIEVIKMVFLVQEVITYNVFALTDLGVSYNSAWKDYAEWFPKANMAEQFRYGDIVGIHNGLITSDLTKAQYVSVISQAPCVYGNVPATKEEELKGEKVAFMGQVPVWIVGEVTQGDFIVAKTDQSGGGIAVKSDDITLEMLPRIVGKALNSNIFEGDKLVNVMVGLTNDDWQMLMQQNADELSRLESELKILDNRIDVSNDMIINLLQEKRGEETNSLPNESSER